MTKIYVVLCNSGEQYEGTYTSIIKAFFNREIAEEFANKLQMEWEYHTEYLRKNEDKIRECYERVYQELQKKYPNDEDEFYEELIKTKEFDDLVDFEESLNIFEYYTVEETELEKDGHA